MRLWPTKRTRAARWDAEFLNFSLWQLREQDTKQDRYTLCHTHASIHTWGSCELESTNEPRALATCSDGDVIWQEYWIIFEKFEKLILLLELFFIEYWFYFFRAPFERSLYFLLFSRLFPSQSCLFFFSCCFKTMALEISQDVGEATTQLSKKLAEVKVCDAGNVSCVCSCRPLPDTIAVCLRQRTQNSILIFQKL